jgi:hypothetical protein
LLSNWIGTRQSEKCIFTTLSSTGVWSSDGGLLAGSVSDGACLDSTLVLLALGVDLTTYVLALVLAGTDPLFMLLFVTHNSITIQH